MTLIPPMIPPTTPYPGGFKPWNSITPFTFVDGETNLEYVERLRKYAYDLAPEVDGNVQILVDSFVEQVTNLIGTVDGISSGLVESVNTQLEAQDEAATTQLAAQQASITGQFAAQQTSIDNQLEAQDTQVSTDLANLTTFVNESVAAIIEGTIPVADPVIAAAAADNNSETTDSINDGWFPFRELFSTIPGYAYGNSWIAFPQYGAQQYPMRLPARIGLASMANYANSAFRMQDTAINAIGPFIAPFAGGKVAYPWTVGTKGIVVVGDLLNNLIEADDQRNRDTALESARALCAILSASSRIEETNVAFTYTGAAWTTLTKDQLSGGTAKYISAWNPTPGEENLVTYVDVAVPAGVNYLLFTATDGAVQGADINIKDGATLLGTVHTNRRNQNTSLRANDGRGPVVFRVPGTTARTLRITGVGGQTTGTVQNFAIVDALLPQLTDPPLIIFVKPVQTTIATHNKPDMLTYLRTIPDTLAAEFGRHVVSVDPAPGWNPATMLGADGLHPNELGYAHILEPVQAAIKVATVKRLAAKMGMVA